MMYMSGSLSVYINLDLTSAQAQLAYEKLECRRYRIEMQSNYGHTATAASTHQIDTDFTSTKSLHASDDSTLTCSTNSAAILPVTVCHSRSSNYAQSMRVA